MQTFKDIEKEFLEKLHSDWEYAKTLPEKDTVNTRVCTTINRLYGQGMTTVMDMTDALEEVNEDTTFKEGYIEVTTKIANVVEGYCDDGEIEVEYVDTYLETTAIRPMTENGFNKLLGDEYVMNKYLKDYISSKVAISQGSKYERTCDCKILELYRNGIIDYDQVVKATYSDCAV